MIMMTMTISDNDDSGANDDDYEDDDVIHDGNGDDNVDEARISKDDDNDHFLIKVATNLAL